MWRLAAGVVLVALIAAGCSSGSSTLDTGATETAVALALGADLPVEVLGVECPAEIDQGVDVRIECSALLADDAGTMGVRVTQVDEKATLRVVAQAAVLSDGEMAVAAKAALRDSFERSFQVDCGEGPPKVRIQGDTITCRARDADTRRELTITVADRAGTLSFAVGDELAD